MNVDHPDRTDLLRFLRGELSAGENRQVVRQLLTRSPAIPEPERPEEELADDFADQDVATTGYSRAFEEKSSRVRATALELARERERLPELAARLAALPPPEQRLAVRSDRSFHCWTFCEWLIDEYRRHIYGELTRAVELADLAVTVTEQLSHQRYGVELVHDIQARAWSCAGEVLRILSDLPGADEAFAIAEKAVGRGTGDALEEAHVLELKAGLRRDQQRYAEAHRLLDEVIAIYRQYRDFHLVGRGFVQKGRVFGAANELKAAIHWVRKGLALIDDGRERRLELAACHGLMLYLHESGRHEEAWFLLKASRLKYFEHGGDLLTLRLRWLEGKIQLALGHLEEAEAALVDARRGFITQGAGFYAASASLDLAGLYAGQGHLVAMRRVAEEMLPIFRSRDIHREAIAALIVFQQAVRMEKVSADLLRAIGAYLRRARKDYKLRFEYPG
jgi:tetratricopeptide (TPR) repeat protein